MQSFSNICTGLTRSQSTSSNDTLLDTSNSGCELDTGLPESPVNQLPAHSKHFVPSYISKRHPLPKTVAEVEDAVLEMDRIQGTTFYNWIKSESNIGYICAYKTELFEYYFENDGGARQVGLAIRWLTGGWVVANRAALILKLFYHWHIESLRFAQVIAHVIAQDFSSPPFLRHELFSTENLELIQILLIGEPPEISAQFISHLLQECNYMKKRPESVYFIIKLARILRWSERFMTDFFIEFVNVSIVNEIHRAKLLKLVHPPELLEFSSLSNNIISEKTDQMSICGVETLSRMSLLDINDDLSLNRPMTGNAECLMFPRTSPELLYLLQESKESESDQRRAVEREIGLHRTFYEPRFLFYLEKTFEGISYEREYEMGINPTL